MDPLDYGRSYLVWTTQRDTSDSRKPGHMPWLNNVRILLDARAWVEDDVTQQRDEFFLIAPCRREWMYRDDDQTIQQPGGEYRMAWSRTRALNFGRAMNDATPRSRSVPINRARFLRLDFDLSALPRARRLATDLEIAQATQTREPIVVQTEIWDTARRRRAVLEYPAKTLSHIEERGRFQMDTGPLLWADLASDEPEPIDWLWLAHTVYNRLDRAQFVRRAPAPVVRDGREVGQVDDYSVFHAQDARHTFFVAG
ncbi:MAG: hypothetical protein FJ029_06025 [Actinobacteria bacterium]|nr:hypothetical protein [Actinomycetota bacterium]